MLVRLYIITFVVVFFENFIGRYVWNLTIIGCFSLYLILMVTYMYLFVAILLWLVKLKICQFFKGRFILILCHTSLLVNEFLWDNFCFPFWWLAYPRRLLLERWRLCFYFFRLNGLLFCDFFLLVVFWLFLDTTTFACKGLHFKHFIFFLFILFWQ